MALSSLSLTCMLWSILITSLCSAHTHPRLHARHAKAHKRAATDTNETDLYFRFVTRPDIGALKWDITVYDEQALAPGYWFLAPYANLKQTTFPLWNGPHIYDQRGELVWSGSGMFHHFNTHDFQPIQLHGEQMMSLIFPHDEPGSKAMMAGMGFPPGQNGSGIILDSSYNFHKTIYMRGNLPSQNMHDLTVREDGTRALMLTAKPDKEVPLSINGYDGLCKIGWQGMKEMNVDTNEIIYEWQAEGHIGIHESTKQDDDWEVMCQDEWDLLHFNSIDKFENGDYLVSARHTSTVYRISPKDDSIVWRLGGLKSSFEFKGDPRGVFTRQHHSKIYSENSTHTLISVFANNKGTGTEKPELPSQDSSLGLLLALRTDVEPMTAEPVSIYERPDGGFTPSRGSVSFLPNGNAFVGWTYGSLQSEHALDGRILMKAELSDPAANSYRSYKRPWVGRPSQPPDVHSVAVWNGQMDVTTLVYVSWNGATEVATWNVLHTNHAGNGSEVLASSDRQGFETTLSCNRFAKYVVVVGYDAKGDELGRSKVFETVRPPALDESLAVAEEAQWLQSHSSASGFGVELSGLWPYATGAFLLGMIFAMVASCIGLFLVRRGKAKSGSNGTFRWLSRLPTYRSESEGNEDDHEQRQWMLDEKEVIEAEKSST